MKITASGYSRNVVGDHTLTTYSLKEKDFYFTEEGVGLFVPKTNGLALSGHFSLRIHLTIAELQQALQCATIKKLEDKIAKLEKKLAEH